VDLTIESQTASYLKNPATSLPCRYILHHSSRSEIDHAAASLPSATYIALPHLKPTDEGQINDSRQHRQHQILRQPCPSIQAPWYAAPSIPPIVLFPRRTAKSTEDLY
jgi:hypothetical protein